MTMSKRVGILVGGGDVPGLNMCLKSLIYRVIDEGFDPIGIRKGWEGLLNYDYHDPTTYANNFIELNKNMVRPIDRSPGSFLHASRINPLAVPYSLLPGFLKRDKAKDEKYDLTDHLHEVVERLGFRALVCVGDDDMLKHAAHLSQKGVPIIAIPKTIHNNIYGTDYTIGFSTGLARSVAFIHELRALAGSREQIIVVETFRINSGLSTLMAGFLAGVDRVVIPEVNYDPERLAYLLQHDKQLNPNNYAVLVISDGAHLTPEKAEQYAPRLSPPIRAELKDGKNGKLLAAGTGSAGGLVGSGMVAAELLGYLTGEEVFLQPLTYLLRTGSPDGQDLLGATNFAIMAARLLKEGKVGRMTAYQKRYNLTDVPIEIVTQGVNGVDIEQMYDVEGYKPKVNLIWAALEE